MKPARSCALFALLAVSSARAASGTDVTLPPRVVHHVDALYPEQALHEGVDGTVALFITVAADGRVADVAVAESGGRALDEAALEAAKQWTFEPATRNGHPVASRIRVAFHFAPPADPGAASTGSKDPGSLPKPLPPETSPSAAASGPAQASAEAPAGMPDLAGGVTDGHSHAHAPEPPTEVTVGGVASRPARTTSDITLDGRLAWSAPRRTGIDWLRSAPGFYVSEPEGPAGPPELFIRGFDAEHGRDVELSAAGVPLNQPSHVHAHGYAEQRGVLAEVVRGVRVRGGVYDPRQGEYAVAGSVEYLLGVRDRGVRISGSYGQYDTGRAVALWAPPDESEETFGVFAYDRSDGATPGRAYRTATGMGQLALTLGTRSRVVIHAASHVGQSNQIGAVREDDVAARIVRLGDSYPNAGPQDIASSRTQLSARFESASSDGAHVELTPYVALTSFRLRENFTGYTASQDVTSDRADLFDEQNDNVTVGASAFYRTPRWAGRVVQPRFELGTSLRHDSVTQSTDLLLSSGSARWGRLVEADVRQSTLGAYADLDLPFGELFALRGGGRFDFIAQTATDRLRRDAEGLPVATVGTGSGVLSPRVSAEAHAAPWLTFTAGYGRGFRSAPARVLIEQATAPISVVDSYELGAAVSDAAKRILASLTAFRTSMSSDLEFDPTSGTVEPVGPTTRTGVAAYFKITPSDAFEHVVSATYARATLDDPPVDPADPGGPRAGDPVAFVPPLVVRSDTSFHLPVGRVHGEPVTLSGGLGQTLLSERPVSGASWLPVVYMLDATVAARYRAVQVGLQGTNLLGLDYVDSAFRFGSKWSAGQSSDEPTRHLIAGTPRLVMAKVILFL